jgi:hypothetical protein
VKELLHLLLLLLPLLLGLLLWPNPGHNASPCRYRLLHLRADPTTHSSSGSWHPSSRCTLVHPLLLLLLLLLGTYCLRWPYLLLLHPHPKATRCLCCLLLLLCGGLSCLLLLLLQQLLQLLLLLLGQEHL